jgi:hypothetical protein
MPARIMSKEQARMIGVVMHAGFEAGLRQNEMSRLVHRGSLLAVVLSECKRAKPFAPKIAKRERFR